MQWISLRACARAPLGLVLAALMAGTPSTVLAGASRDVVNDFAALAQQRPWRCTEATPTSIDAPRWTLQAEQCAWQNRLRMRRSIVGAAAAIGECVSAPAQLWSRASTVPGSAPAHPGVWRSHWQSHSLHVRGATEERILILERGADGAWNATEWRWRPSPRAATRRWQAGRWAQLVARAAQLRAAPAADEGSTEARMLAAVLDGHLGQRTAELSGAVWRWHADGACLRADLAGLGPPQLQLPYALDDSRLEQRAAMQLHLARRFPKANWLVPFRLLSSGQLHKGGAKFFALWSEEGKLKGQLWMPTRRDGPLVRVRIDTPLPPQEAQRNRAGALIEQQLRALALRWADAYE